MAKANGSAALSEYAQRVIDFNVQMNIDIELNKIRRTLTGERNEKKRKEEEKKLLQSKEEILTKCTNAFLYDEAKKNHMMRMYEQLSGENRRDKYEKTVGNLFSEMIPK